MAKHSKQNAEQTGQAARPVAYSYTRFSSAEQRQGDSYRRQTEAAQKYADEHGLDLDTTTRFDDAAVSAYKGKNSKSGKLREFMRLVEDGLIAEGSYLLVENLDRISRQAPWDALPVFQSILNEGIIIVTLQDRKVWSREVIRGNPMKIMESLFSMITAHDESEKKARRLRALWAQKRKLAKTVKLTARCPSWLRLSTDRTTFIVIPERAKIVRRVFKMTADGAGQNKIASTLNAENVPTFDGGALWYRSYIAKMLSNESVVGTLVPHVVSFDENGKRVRKPLDKVKNYYPRVISDDLWSRVRALAATASSQRGRHASQGKLSNLFAGLCRCGRCGSTMTLVTKNARDRYLICTRAKTKGGCRYTSLRYGDIEQQFLEGVDLWLDRDMDVGLEHPEAERLASLRSSIEASQDALRELAMGTSPAVRTTIPEIAASIQRLEKEEAELAEKVAQSVPLLVQKRLDEAYEALTQPSLDRTEANRRLRIVLNDVRFDFASGQAVMSWKHGATTSVMFRWPEEAH